ncbi:hypothetical protein V1514DRAFT_328691 [Lipomyces japonicus]|uniref:uncharacterized protein n=1 Tax=Lipomyces japonicus TaxID=56871 RepID=UPI0034CD81BB
MLLELPHEVLSSIFASCSPTDVLAASATCNYLRSFVLNNEVLWRELMRAVFDDDGDDGDNAILQDQQIVHVRAFEEFKRRTVLLLRNGPNCRSQYASAEYRARVQDDLVRLAIRLLANHACRNYDILAKSQLFSAVVFDQFLPGTLPALYIDRAWHPSTLPPATIGLHQQPVDMLRLVFGHRMGLAPLTHSISDIQAMVYNSNRFPLFATTRPEIGHLDAGSIFTHGKRRRLDQQQDTLPDSAWSDQNFALLKDPARMMPNFATLVAILNFFVHHIDHTPMVRQGLWPFFNTPPDGDDLSFKNCTDLSSLSFEMLPDWTGLYGYLAFWDFDLLRRTGTASSRRHVQIDDAESTTADITMTTTTTTTIPTIPTTVSIRPFSQSREGQDIRYATMPDVFDCMQVMEIDIPAVSGPACFIIHGRDKLDYVAKALIVPLEPCFGLPGFARFGMRKQYVRVMDDDLNTAGGRDFMNPDAYEDDDEDEVVWEYNGVFIAGSKIILGRWRDGNDTGSDDAVEGPFIFFADEL